MAHDNADGWRQRYLAHLRSPYWDALRRDVVARAAGHCEKCRREKATQVHHLHYRTMGRESLNDVLALCDSCHRRAHGIKKAPKPTRRKPKPEKPAKPAKSRAKVQRGPFRNPPMPEGVTWTFRDRYLAERGLPPVK